MSISRVATALQSKPAEVYPLHVSNAEAENLLLREEVARLRIRLVELEKSADTDPLVDVFNHRAFMRELSRAQAVNARYDIHSTVLFFDLNGFKSINDRYGHGVGDELLVKVGQILCSGIRHCDMVARLGGDEFGVLLFKTDIEIARAKAASLAAEISGLEVPCKSGTVNVTASWGLASCDSEQTAKQILARADRAMYAAKRQLKENIDFNSIAGF